MTLTFCFGPLSLLLDSETNFADNLKIFTIIYSMLFHYPSIPRCAKFAEHVVSEKYWYVCVCLCLCMWQQNLHMYGAWEWWFLFVFDNKFVDLLSFSIPLCNVSNTYQKFVANTCKLKCAIYTGTQSYLRRYSHAHLVTLLSLVRSAVFVFVVAHVRDTCSCFLPSSAPPLTRPQSSLSTWPPTFARFNT